MTDIATPTNVSEQELQQIEAVVRLYFEGTHYSDRGKLMQAFHPAAHITGNIAGAFSNETLTQFVDRLFSQPSQADLGHRLRKRILSIDLTHDAAIAKADVYVGDYHFVDYMTLLKLGDNWVIRHKSFTVVAP